MLPAQPNTTGVDGRQARPEAQLQESTAAPAQAAARTTAQAAGAKRARNRIHRI